MFPLALLNAASPPMLPTGILLFNGTNGTTTTVNSGTIGSATLFNGAALSTAQAYEGVSSCLLTAGSNKFARYTPTSTSGNNNLVSKSFYMSVAFRLDAIDASQRGLLFCENISGLVLFRAYVQSGVVKCYIREASGTINTVTVPSLTCLANTWYKLEIIRNSATSQFTVKVGSDSVNQSIGNFDPTVGVVDIGAHWSGASFLGYVDRFIYQPDSIVPY